MKYLTKRDVKSFEHYDITQVYLYNRVWGGGFDMILI